MLIRDASTGVTLRGDGFGHLAVSERQHSKYNVCCLSIHHGFTFSAVLNETLLHHPAQRTANIWFTILSERHSMQFKWIHWIPPHSISRATQGYRGNGA